MASVFLPHIVPADARPRSAHVLVQAHRLADDAARLLHPRRAQLATVLLPVKDARTVVLLTKFTAEENSTSLSCLKI